MHIRFAVQVSSQPGSTQRRKQLRNLNYFQISFDGIAPEWFSGHSIIFDDTRTGSTVLSTIVVLGARRRFYTRRRVISAGRFCLIL